MCGEAEGGKLGLGDISNAVKTPTLVQTIPDKVVQVACGGAQTIAITGKYCFPKHRKRDLSAIALGMSCSLSCR